MCRECQFTLRGRPFVKTTRLLSLRWDSLTRIPTLPRASFAICAGVLL
ncbi:MAG: hypothetical protein IKM65_08550 [Bacteroidaceae bacterium]|nr:hypothetical protein [Bacteroidaceae bacterium]